MDSDFHEKVEIFVCCRDVKSQSKQKDIQIKCYLQELGDWKFLGQTEVITDNPQPNFANSFVLDFYFEIQQPIKFEILNLYKKNVPEVLGTVETTVGSIMGARMQTSSYDLKVQDRQVPGQLITQAEKVGYGVDCIRWQWKGVKLLNTDGRFGKSDPFLRFYKIRENGEPLKVYETEAVKDNLNPAWKPFEIPAGKLCYDNSQLFRVECLDWEKAGKYQLIGSCEVSLDMIQGGYASLELTHPKKKKAGTLQISDFELKSTVSFVDYVRGGTQLNAIVAIDFTASNGEPTTPESLHARLPEGELNEYQKAIKAVCEIVLNYDFDQLVPVYGFGGRPHYPTLDMKQTSHSFPCTGNVEQHHVLGLDGIMGVYNYALENVELAGPTLFAPLINETMNVCKIHKQDQADIYTILLILTDGEIHDVDKTIETIIDASQLPLSIIIIGVGQAEFTNMVILDGDKGLVGIRGRKSARDIVQFVPFRDFKGDMTQLAQHVLAEVPDQLVGYMRMIGRKPLPPRPV